MPNNILLRGVTLVLIGTAETAEIARKSSVIATANLCFGDGINSVIACIDFIQVKGKETGWRLPTYIYPKDEGQTVSPVFTGQLAVEITKMAANALDRIKKEHPGGFKWNRTYAIPTSASARIYEIDPKVKVA